jgi:hypothetical protein
MQSLNVLTRDYTRKSVVVVKSHTGNQLVLPFNRIYLLCSDCLLLVRLKKFKSE